MKTDSLSFERNLYIGVPADRLWEGITVPEIVSRYYLTALLEIELYVGSMMRFESLGMMTIDAQILDLEVGKRLIHSFAFTAETHEGVATDPPTQVSYEIWPMREMSYLELRHTGFPGPNRTYQNISAGWDRILCGLKTVLETGKPLPWPARN